MDVNCKHCGRYLFKQVGTVVIEGLICGNSACKARLNFKFINSDPMSDMKYKFVNPEQAPKEKKV